MAPHLLDQVAEPLEVDGGGGQPPLRLLLALAVLQDPGRLLDHRPALGGRGVEDGVEPALAHDDVLSAADAGVGEQLGDVQQPAGIPVEGVGRLAVARQAAGDGDPGSLDGQGPVGVVDGDRHLGPGGGWPLGRAREDDVVHLPAPQRAGPLGAEGPGHGVDHVGLARAVGSHDHGHARLELERGPLREGLEALEGE
jgi:hypothetical protein